MTRGTFDDDLLTPTLEGVRRDALPEGDRPWRIGSQVYVGFFGGPLAVGAIAYVNGGRLAMEGPRRAVLLGVGLAGLLAALVAAIVVGEDSVRFVGRAAGLATAGALYWLMRPADRRYAMRRPEEYDSLLGPGFAAVVLLGVLELLIVLGAVKAFP
jgi:hypothetical protein